MRGGRLGAGAGMLTVGDRDLGCEGPLKIHLSGRSRKNRGGLTSMLTDPSTFNSSPSRADSREDFPAPTGPTTASRQPLGTVRLILTTQGRCSPEDPAWVCTEAGNPRHPTLSCPSGLGETIKRICRAFPLLAPVWLSDCLPSHI